MKKKLLIITETILITQLVLSIAPIIGIYVCNSEAMGLIIELALWTMIFVFPFGEIVGAGVAAEFYADVSFHYFFAVYIVLLLMVIAFIYMAYKAKRLWAHLCFKWSVYVLFGFVIIYRIIGLFDLHWHKWYTNIAAIGIPIAILIMVAIALNRNEGTPLNKPIDLSRL